MTDQSGRSMVEMLGVLAVMGILSVAGVKAYTYAMNRHRANELIYEANKRATSVAMQIAAGRNMNDLSISDFPNPAGYTFSASGENEQQFKITLDEVDKDICAQMKSSLGDSTVIRKMSENCTEIIFNNDLSKISEAQCTGVGKIWCASTGLCSDTGACCGGKDCTATNCPSGSSIGGAGGTTGVFVNGSECKCDEETEFYTSNECAAQPETCHDWNKNECGFGYYCDFAYTDENQTGTLDLNNQSCYTNLSGTCKKINISSLSETQLAILKKAGFKTTLVRGPRTNWWSAFNWCIGQGKRPLDVSEIECYRATNNTLIRSGDRSWSYCCKKGMQCQQSSWTNMWSDQEIIEGQEDEVKKFSDKMVALKKAYVWDYAWTASSAYAGNSSNSCAVFGPNFSGGNLYQPYRKEHHIYALCQ